MRFADCRLAATSATPAGCVPPCTVCRSGPTTPRSPSTNCPPAWSSRLSNTCTTTVSAAPTSPSGRIWPRSRTSTGPWVASSSPTASLAGVRIRLRHAGSTWPPPARRPTRCFIARIRRTASSKRAIGTRPFRTASTTAARACSGSGGISSTSAPASRARTATSPGGNASLTPPISSASVTTSPVKPSSSRSTSCRILRLSVAGTSAASPRPGTARWPVITDSSPCRAATPNGYSSTRRSRSPSPGTVGMRRWLSLSTSPCPGKCLPQAIRPSLRTPRANALPSLATRSGSPPKLRTLMIGFCGLLLTSRTGANTQWKPSALASSAVARPIASANRSLRVAPTSIWLPSGVAPSSRNQTPPSKSPASSSGTFASCCSCGTSAAASSTVPRLRITPPSSASRTQRRMRSWLLASPVPSGRDSDHDMNS